MGTNLDGAPVPRYTITDDDDDGGFDDGFDDGFHDGFDVDQWHGTNAFIREKDRIWAAPFG